jgi:hypothetical protein
VNFHHLAMANTTNQETNADSFDTTQPSILTTLIDPKNLEIDQYDPIAIRSAMRQLQILNRSPDRAQDFLNVAVEQFDIHDLLSVTLFEHKLFWVCFRDMLRAAQVDITYGRGVNIIKAVLTALTSDQHPSTIQSNQTERVYALSELNRIQSLIRSNETARSTHTPIATPDSGTPATTTTITRESYKSDPAKISQAVNTKFYADAKFSGSDTGPPLQDVIDRYADVMQELQLDGCDKFRFLHIMLRDEAKRFYDRNVRAHCHENYSEALSLLRKEYESPARQSTVIQGLRTLTIQRVCAEKRINKLESLKFIYEEIARLAPSCPKIYHADAAKATLLYEAVQGEPWAVNPLVNFNKNRETTTLSALYHELHSSLTVSRPVQGTNAMSMSQTHFLDHEHTYNEDDENEVFYNERYAHRGRSQWRGRRGRMGHTNRSANHRMFGQGRESYCPRQQGPPRDHRFGTSHEQQREDAKMDNLCFRCMKPGHYARTCPHDKRTFREAVQARVKTYLDHMPYHDAVARTFFDIDASRDPYHNQLGSPSEAELDCLAAAAAQEIEPTADVMLADAVDEILASLKDVSHE